MALILLGAAAADGQPAPAEGRVAALVGLARTARDQGRAAEAALRFGEADRVQQFTGPLLVEFFWTAHAAREADAMTLGARVLAANAHDARVRDGMIGLAVAAGDEATAARLAEQGRLLEPNMAVWMRRLGEGHLRVGRYLLGAQQFLAASAASGGGPADRAQWAFCLELSRQRAEAARAWMSVPDGLSSRRDWTESRARALAPAPAPPVRRAEAAAPTPAEVVAAAERRLGAQACATELLADLERLAEAEPFVKAVALRPSACTDHAAWILARRRAADRHRWVRTGADDREPDGRRGRAGRAT
jgi:hypothetical protein